MTLRGAARPSSELPLETRSFSISHGMLRRSPVVPSVIGLLASDEEDPFPGRPRPRRSLRTRKRAAREDEGDDNGRETAIKMAPRTRRSCRLLRSNQEALSSQNHANSIMTLMKNSRKSGLNHTTSTSTTSATTTTTIITTSDTTTAHGVSTVPPVLPVSSVDGRKSSAMPSLVPISSSFSCSSSACAFHPLPYTRSRKKAALLFCSSASSSDNDSSYDPPSLSSICLSSSIPVGKMQTRRSKKSSASDNDSSSESHDKKKSISKLSASDGVLNVPQDAALGRSLWQPRLNDPVPLHVPPIPQPTKPPSLPKRPTTRFFRGEI